MIEVKAWKCENCEGLWEIIHKDEWGWCKWRNHEMCAACATFKEIPSRYPGEAPDVVMDEICSHCQAEKEWKEEMEASDDA